MSGLGSGVGESDGRDVRFHHSIDEGGDLMKFADVMLECVSICGRVVAAERCLDWVVCFSDRFSDDPEIVDGADRVCDDWGAIVNSLREFDLKVLPAAQATESKLLELHDLFVLLTARGALVPAPSLDGQTKRDREREREWGDREANDSDVTRTSTSTTDMETPSLSATLGDANRSGKRGQGLSPAPPRERERETERGGKRKSVEKGTRGATGAVAAALRVRADRQRFQQLRECAAGYPLMIMRFSDVCTRQLVGLQSRIVRCREGIEVFKKCVQTAITRLWLFRCCFKRRRRLLYKDALSDIHWLSFELADLHQAVESAQTALGQCPSLSTALARNPPLPRELKEVARSLRENSKLRRGTSGTLHAGGGWSHKVLVQGGEKGGGLLGVSEMGGGTSIYPSLGQQDQSLQKGVGAGAGEGVGEGRGSGRSRPDIANFQQWQAPAADWTKGGLHCVVEAP
uniref:Uncharacterized protein n=2 Tax=Chromera velia CCMP2878 TaxID=1169474 RepID=A0A0G4HNF6_9ALVE|eukprot:Cvel_29486.t1-p1 / transcript=Cvel_29486.t1 / gene=Cvel_29486 / organism=Chromera_velia_CCMP2878 / gene_product=hypothetical protein / transcript_product=hypothetical protein / location=Cvel_scaffold4046:9286-11708(+) / protein_length=458 / sequence_SO=supercontig / SO=protein_coding / is_pseudo=false